MKDNHSLWKPATNWNLCYRISPLPCAYTLNRMGANAINCNDCTRTCLQVAFKHARQIFGGNRIRKHIEQLFNCRMHDFHVHRAQCQNFPFISFRVAQLVSYCAEPNRTFRPIIVITLISADFRRLSSAAGIFWRKRISQYPSKSHFHLNMMPSFRRLPFAFFQNGQFMLYNFTSIVLNWRPILCAPNSFFIRLFFFFLDK